MGQEPVTVGQAMCGRYANRRSDKELQSFFDTMHTVGDELPPSYNVAPTQPVRVIIERPPPARNPTPSPSASSGRSNGACCRLV